MTLRSIVIKSGGHRLDTSLIKKPAEINEYLASLKKETCDFATYVLCSICNSIIQKHQVQSKAKISCRKVLSCPDQSSAGGLGHKNWEPSGALILPSTKQMGAEGSPVKSRSLFCQTNHNHLVNMDPMVSNDNNQQREGEQVGAMVGDSSPEDSPSGKHWNVRKGSGLVDPQTSCIRQILLLQLELIEQQQKHLHNKNKEIEDLKAEKEMLMARIERMEHRLQMVKKDGVVSRPSQTTCHKEPEAETTTSDDVQHSGGRVQTPKQTQRGRGVKGSKGKFLLQDSPTGRSRRGQPRSPPTSQQESPALKEDMQCHSKEVPYLTTTEMYLSHWQTPPSPQRDPSTVHENTVEVPSWRESILEPLGQKEASDILECLDDSVFLKRHSKLELDEKRRKRWDIQRIREQRMFQRLQQRMNRRKVIQESEPELLSFHAEPEDVEYIMVTPFLPVVAFGSPLPNLKQQDFDLPWLDERSRCQPEVTKKRTPRRRCRK
ncbi:male-specific lethal 1-like 1 [Danio rerio]|uniref:Male-specific lethal 1-like 1 n=1 Tax=Danio rerio TaxID=7955 RepID=MSL1_DANRE|nr:male-specific lethal 1-like 1 [Danio rerio]A9JRX0.1 RecName: Full=Male-specific lethal 1-like 1; Short=MSL1-like 1; AltName: Full=Male-specific lethal-1 homolog 1; Short=MSL-1 [Danio rerio]AAI55828.1 Zgc:175094 protein [Danio rerio]|eukprot:NP_001107940.1 male-specific lethal 1-like 1 [Danio rerio]